MAKLSAMRRLIFLFVSILFTATIAFGQNVPVTKANYQLASKFSPKKLEKILFTTNVDPHWLKKSDRFWYSYETTDGRRWFIVDPAKGTKQVLFDNDKLA